MLKVKWNVLPDSRRPELKTPLSAVTVWATLSLLVQVTVVPALIVKLLGLNAKLAMEMPFPLLPDLVVAAVVGVALLPLEYALVGAALGVVPLSVVVEAGVVPQEVMSKSRPIAHRQSQVPVILVNGEFSIVFLQISLMCTCYFFVFLMTTYVARLQSCK